MPLHEELILLVISFSISSGRKMKFLDSREVAWYIMKLVLVPWNANGAGDMDCVEMLELSGELSGLMYLSLIGVLLEIE